MLLGCGHEAAGGPAAEGEVSDEAALTKKAPVEAFMSGLAGSWYGEVRDIYRACARISALDAARPWALQTLTVTVDEGAIETTTLTLSRNASAAVADPVYALAVPASQSPEPVFFNGTYVLSRGPAQQLAFWRPFSGEHSTSIAGIEVSKAGPTLKVGVMAGDTYCTLDGVTQICGTGGYRPFALKRGTCPF